ncbi:Heat-inducible transcription repressor HrcA [invertebrate metagenome]|uniref:Heat-inducible transcription repressor HrcA n=1 Tax=invertebrate metagenome TaxID=1711999 RepID=A0A484H8J7_9ZZZZ
MTGLRNTTVAQLSERSREIFRRIVDAYVRTGDPIGSRTLARQFGMDLSPATIRNVMADLEEAGLLRAPHSSAGRLPTEAGLRLFVDGLLEVRDLAEEERRYIDTQCQAAGRSVEDVLGEATAALSGLSHCVGLMMAPKLESPLKHIEFINLGPGRALVILVNDKGLVENRIIDIPDKVSTTALIEATNFLNARITGLTLEEVRETILVEVEDQRCQLDALTSRVVEAGLAIWNSRISEGVLIVRGQSHLLEDVTALDDLERIRTLFEILENGERVLRLLDQAHRADGVQIFIGAENKLFLMSGCSIIVAPYRNRVEQIIGAIGVVGPTRINYARIIPMVDYTAKMIGRLIG